MTGSAGLEPASRFLTHPLERIAELVVAVEPQLRPEVVMDTVRGITSHLGQQRRLARVLHERPDLLTSGWPDGPPTVELLIRALQPLGTTRLALPACASCGRSRPLTQRDAEGHRVCGSCHTRARWSTAQVAPCASCQVERPVRYQDRAGGRVAATARPSRAPTTPARSPTGSVTWIRR